MKQQLEGKQFQGVEMLDGVISDMPQSTWSGAMVMWFERMTKCVRAEGDYYGKTGLGKKIRTCTKSSTSRNFWGAPRILDHTTRVGAHGFFTLHNRLCQSSRYHRSVDFRETVFYSRQHGKFGMHTRKRFRHNYDGRGNMLGLTGEERRKASRCRAGQC